MSAPLILATNSIKDTGYNVANSCRFEDASDDYLSRSVSSSGNRRTWTFSAWVKRANTTQQYQNMFAAGLNNIRINFSNQNIWVYDYNGSSFDFYLITNRLFRDVSAWYHIVVAVDTTQGTDSNRVKLYINGVQETSFSTETYPSQNHDTEANTSGQNNVIGTDANSLGNNGFHGYMCEVVLIDGQQLDPTSFGEFNEDSPTHWQPIDVSGLTFGTNGFHLDFEDSSALGNDVSGNNNDFTPSNLAATDQSTDTCTNNFATLNPLDVATSGTSTFAEGNLKMTTDKQSRTTFGASSGKWYVEAKYVNNTAANGIAQMDGSNTFNTNSIVLFGSSNGTISVSGSDTDTNVGAGTAIADNSIIMFAMDLDNNRLYLGKNGSWWTDGSGFVSSDLDSFKTITRVTGDTFGFKCSNYSGTGTTEWNFGSPPFAISSGNADGEGFGNFEYAVPSGYFALCTKNLSEYG
jgi:hypothetical protein